MNTEIREVVVSLAAQMPIKQVAMMFEGIVSKPTIYRWVSDVKELSYAYETKRLENEWKNIRERSGDYASRPTYNKITTTFQPHFFHVENKLYKNKDIRNALIENRKKYLFKETFNDRELLRGFKISGIHIGYSHFSPLWIKKFIEDNNVRSVYDPCGGWGHRLLGAAATSAKYIYNDKWDKTYNGATKIQQFINSKFSQFNNDCREFTLSEDYDAIFTCPPYYNTELYQDNYSSIDDYKQFISKMFSAAIKPPVNLIGIVINDQYADIIIGEIPDTFKLRETHLLGSTNMVNHFNNKKSRKSEKLLIFERCVYI